MDEASYKQLKAASRSPSLVLTGDLNPLSVCWRIYTAGLFLKKQTRGAALELGMSEIPDSYEGQCQLLQSDGKSPDCSNSRGLDKRKWLQVVPGEV